MTDKKIIIDGVDIKGCPRLWNDLNYELKQLKRLEQENAELKKKVRNNETVYQTELSTYNMECGNLLEENKNLIAENERLKAEFKRLKESECKICKYSNIGDKYYQTLQEIKEIAENVVKNYMNVGFKEYDKCIEQILQKITKAEINE